MPSTKPTIRLLQLTDPHLMASPDDLMLGVNTDASFIKVLAAASAEENVDLIVVTGDISGCESASTYQRMVELMQNCSIPSLWLAGNHDNLALMQAAAAQYLQRSVEIGDWLIVTLTSSTPNVIGGKLSASELQALSQTLADSSAANVLLAVHHHLVDIGSTWLDPQKIANAAELFEILEQDKRVKVIIHGHVHQAFDVDHNGIRLLATPSTWAQFTPHSEEFTVDPEGQPGYRVIDLYADGQIDTAVKRIAVDLGLDLSITSY
jgi:Icc protein